jgi:ComF family protein
MQSSFRSVLSLLFQPDCPLCERPAQKVICADCERQLESQRFRNPQRFWQGELPVFVWGRYQGQLKRAIASLKYHNHPDLAQTFGYALGEAWHSSGLAKQPHQLVVVPIPMHPQKLKERGYNQAELIARSFCQYTGLKLQVQALQRIRETTAQFDLGSVEREANLKGAFQLKKRFFNAHRASVLLLDDIYTTGATARNAAACFQKQGISVKGVVAVATSKEFRA